VREFWKRLGKAFWEASQDGCLGHAKGAAYSALLAIFPVLSSTTAILAQVKADSVSEVLTQYLFEAAPPGTADLLEFTLTSRGDRPVLLLIGATALSVLAASGVVLSLIDGFHAAYRVKNRRGFWKHRGIAMSLVVLAALPVVGVSTVLVITNSPAGIPPAMIAVVLSNMTLYRFGPDLPRGRRWVDVWPGAVVATFLWTVSTVGFAWYVRNLATYNVVYGSIAAVIALLIWLYLLSAGALIGCEFNAVSLRERKRY
jgi:membrane protein